MTKKLDPEELWQELPNGKFAIQIKPGLKPKDLPLWFRPAFEYIENAKPSVRYQNGKFWEVKWRRAWDNEETEIPVGAFLVAEDDGGVGVQR